MRKVIRFINKLIDSGLLILFLIAFLIGGYAMYDSYLVYKHATDDSLHKFRPVSKDEFQATTDKISENMVAWLTLYDTEVDYPIMQGETNTEYLNKDPYGKYSLAGSIFLDYRNHADFSDQYNLIYGHHMDGAMFGVLDKFLDEDYFNKHKKGKLITKGEEYDITLFSIADTSAEENSIFNLIGDPLDYFRKNHHFFTEPPEGSKLIALSTCKYPDTVDRTVILGYMSKVGGN